MAALSEQRVVLIDDLLDTNAVEMLSPGGTVLGFTPLAGQETAVKQQLSTPHAHVQCWPKAELPARFDYGHNARVPPIVCMAETGWFLSTRASLARYPPRGGAHGFDPLDPQMAALFMARGPAFRPGTELAGFANVNVYPLLAHLLGIRPEPNQGRLDIFSSALATTP
jgi:predicted AlkP superfamily pyrophosphatase or phosphodiesterase